MLVVRRKVPFCRCGETLPLLNDFFIDSKNFSVLKLCKKSEYNVEMSKTDENCDEFFGK